MNPLSSLKGSEVGLCVGVVGFREDLCYRDVIRK